MGYLNSSIERNDGQLSISEIGPRHSDNFLSLSSDLYLLYLALGESSDLKQTIDYFRQQKFLECTPPDSTRIPPAEERTKRSSRHMPAIILYDVPGHSSSHRWIPDIWRIRYVVFIDVETSVSDGVTCVDSSSTIKDCDTRLFA
jgi:hypothetical protein